MLKKILSGLLTGILMISLSYGSHLMGGEITWKCQANGSFKFTMKVYRDCNGITFSGGNLLTTHPIGNIPMSIVSTNDISPVGQGCSPCNSPGPGSTQEFIMESGDVFLTGTPPPQGWVFYWGSCCRNAAIDNLQNASSQGFTLRAIMYPYNNQPTNPCFDSSPFFAERPNVIMCTRNPFKYNHNAIDPELDSLVYDWGIPLNDGTWQPAPVPYQGGYTFNNPLPGPGQNPCNIGAVMNPQTGEVSFTSFTSGEFVVLTKVTAYKCGVKVAEIFREIQIILMNCLITNSGSAPPFILNASQTAVTCNGGSDGSATIQAIGCSGPYSKLWSTGDTTSTINNLSAGTYWVTVTDGTGCIMTHIFTITQPPPLLVNTNSKPASCGNLNGTIKVKASGGTPPYTYLWSMGSTDTTVINMAPGNYTVTVTDSKGCTASSTINVATISNPSVTLSSSTNATCAGVADGSATISASGLGPFEYLWSNGAETATVSNLAAGNYTVTVTNAPGCTSTLSVTINQNSAITLNISTTPAACDSSNGSATVVANGGVAPYTYNWSNGNLTASNTNIAANPYTLTVSDALGCSVTQEVAVTNTGAPTITLSSTTAVTCPGGADGSAVVSVSGGTAPYTYSWSNGATSDTATGLTGGVHSVTVTDAVGCKAVLIVNIDEPPSLLLAMSSTPVTCASQGTATVVASGGTGPLSYSWNNSSSSTTPSITVPTGNYAVTVTDTMGCSASNTVLVSSSLNNPSISVVNSINVTCNGAANGSASVTASGGSPPYFYYWSNGFNNSSQSNLGAGAYNVTVVDAAGCSASTSITITQPTPINGNFNSNTPFCGQNTGSLSVTASGGTAPYTYLWNTSGTNTSITGLVAAPYSVTITDLNGCSATKFFALNNKISTVYNTDPDVNAPFMDPNSGLFTKYDTTVCVGDTVKFFLNATDFELLSDGITPQTVTITASGSQFGNGFTSTTAGCLNPPCATLTPPPPTSAMFGVGVNFEWVTHCDHLGKDTLCTKISNAYTFVIRAEDNFCPAPAMNFSTIVIRVKVDSVPPPSLRCIQVNNNGSALLTWLPPSTAMTNCEKRSFHAYDIWTSSTLSGPYNFVDSIVGDPNNTSYTHLSSNTNNAPMYYFVTTRWGCDKFSLNPNVSPSDTLRSIYLTVGNTNPEIAVLNWNQMHIPNIPTASGTYMIYKKKGSGGTWTFIGSTQALSFADSAGVCNDSVFYRIEMSDASGCISVSNEAGNLFQTQNITINEPSLRCLAVDEPSGDITVTWVTAPDTADYFDRYELWHSANAAGPFTLIHSTDIFTDTTFTHVGANGHIQSQYYYLKVGAGCDSINVALSSSSDTLRSIFLTVGNANPYIAALNWNALHTPNLPSSTGIYNIFRKTGSAGSWSQIGTTTALTYNDSTNVCADSIFYRIEIADSSGCTSVSNIGENWFQTATPPISPPLLRCLAVNQPSGSITLTWIPAADTAQFFDGYEIYHSTTLAGPYSLIQTINNHSTTSYTHATATGNNQINYYYIKTSAGCDTVNLFTSVSSDTLASIYLTVSPSPGFASLAWNALHTPNLPTTQLPYLIYRNDGSGWVQIGTSNTLNYVDTINDCDVPISYRVEIPDASGCISVSSVASDTFSYQPPLIASPSLRCVAVQTNGDVVLTWVIPPDPDNLFSKYYLYHSSGGPFTVLDSIFTYGQTSYTHTGANANSVINSYYLVSYSGCPNSPLPSPTPSATLNSILLSATTSPGFANLSWNALATPLPATTQLPYNVYRNDGSGWVLIGTTNTTTYVDTIGDCDIPLSYRIEIPDASGCISVSSVDSDIFSFQPPLIASPSLRCVAVQANGDVTLTWVIPPDPDNWFTKYVIYHSTGGPFTILDSVLTYNQTTYTHTGANGNSQVNSYYLVSYSGCPNSAQPSPVPSATLNSILLTATPAMGFANLSWNALATPLPGTSLGVYKVFRNDGSGWVQIGTTSGLTYVDTISDCNIPLSYRVDIDDQSGCTSVSSVDSDTFTYIGDVIANPSFRCVSVQTNGDVTLNWLIPPDPTNFFAGYEIYHSSGGGGFTRLTTINTYNQSNYTHTGANGNSQINTYYLVSLSGCSGTEFSGASDTLSSMLLNATPVLGLANLTWNPMHSPNPFIPSSAGVYEIWRNYDGQGWQQIATTTNEAYTDSINECDVPISYRIEIADASGCKSVSSEDNDTFTYLGEIVDAPSVRCVIVEPNGDVTLNWIAPPDPQDFFNEYELYHSVNKAGPFSLVTSLNTLTQNSYTHSGANGQSIVNYYYFITRSGCTGNEPSVPSDTLASMLLGVNNLSGIAQLNWNPIHTPDLPTSSGVYTIYREYPLGTWTVLGTTTQLTYLDTITVCSADINYRVEMDDASGCTSVSSVDGDLFQDLTPPAVPLIDTVSVDPLTGIVNIGWNVNPSGDTQGYIIYLYNGASFDSIATVSGINSNGFVNTNSNANLVIETYAIAAFDSCGNLSPYSSPHNTILSDSYLDICTSSNVLSWNAYQNMNTGLSQYIIYASIDGGPYTQVGSVDGNTLTFAHTNLVPNVTYCYYVQAVSGDGLLTASSTLTCEFSRILTDPQFSYLRVATVAGENHVLIKAYIDTLADVSGYRVERSVNVTGPYSSVGFVNPPVNSDVLIFTDASASTGSTSYFYRVIVVDSCGNDKFTSNVGRTIFLQATADEFFRNTLVWNDYEEWNGGVESYNLYRVIDGYWEPAPIASVPFGVNSYVDDISKYYESDARFCYVVEAIQGADTIYAFADSSLSNEACAIQPVKHYTPNAFTPGGANPVFRPIQIFIDVNSYTFNVFNRWGEKIYETNDPRAGWDGNVDGKKAPQGVYVYKVEFKGANGSEFKKRGTVTLLR